MVVTRDGRTLERREDVHRGSPERPLTEDDIIAKFMENAQRVLAGARAEKVRDAILNVEALVDTRRLSHMLSPS